MRAMIEQLFIKITPQNKVTYVLKSGDRAAHPISPLKETENVRGTYLSSHLENFGLFAF